jgi:hypothetical protein
MPMVVAVSDANGQRLRKLRTLIGRLPKAEQLLWRARVERLLRKYAASSTVGGAEEKGETEWDLQLANWLDGVYRPVAERVEQVAAKGASAVSLAGFSMWPLVLAGLGLVLISREARSGR